MSSSFLRVNPADDLIVALQDLEVGTEIKIDSSEHCRIVEAIPRKHKFVTRDVARGEQLRMYGVIVGEASRDIPAGSLLTMENLDHSSEPFHANRKQIDWAAPDVGDWQQSTFQGYHRSNGSVGTANYWIVIPTVFCENRNLLKMSEALHGVLGYQTNSGYRNLAQRLAKAWQQGATIDQLAALDPGSPGDLPERLLPNVDGIKFLTHDGGCGGTREDSQNLCGILAGYACHPNVAGVTVLSLGCQHAQVSILEDEIQKRDSNFDKPLLIFEQQKAESEWDMMTRAIRETFAGMVKANELTRQPASLDKLIVGVECGASDGFSGISANPLIGAVADRVVGLGGSVVLSEFPELCGVEQDLVNRCTSQELADRFVDIMQRYEARAVAVGSGFAKNPSPGNIKDGLITDAIKSAGAALKGGRSPVKDVLDYPGWVTKRGLNLLCTAGNDVESTTGMAGAGANLILFSTGLGTPTGNPVCPVIKVSSNTKTSESFSDMIDFDAGPIIDGSTSIPEHAAQLLNLSLEVASGKPTAAMKLGQDDFIVWKRGVSL
ncbi:UxaA family hydrolase [Mariniblastus fucicola]|uniref:UxaA family hydrolase n=1 Tax=Mariniblastus fucicola TaxID=980251 RepID=UPI00192E5798|nr:altronate dehydratase family protein [Mariniblastus fucicola]